MSEYRPDRWVIIRLVGSDTFKVFATWAGGWAGDDAWRTSSGIVSVTDCGHYYNVVNSSWSEYLCHKNSEGIIGGIGTEVFNKLLNTSKVEVVSIESLLDKQKGHI